MFERLAGILIVIGALLLVLAAWIVFPAAGVAVAGVFCIWLSLGLTRIVRNDSENH
jgi:predicted phage tail protein